MGYSLAFSFFMLTRKHGKKTFDLKFENLVIITIKKNAKKKVVADVPSCPESPNSKVMVGPKRGICSYPIIWNTYLPPDNDCRDLS